LFRKTLALEVLILISECSSASSSPVDVKLDVVEASGSKGFKRVKRASKEFEKLFYSDTLTSIMCL